MLEWHVPFDYIEEHWTDRQFIAMLNAMADRLEKEAEAMQQQHGTRTMSLKDFRRLRHGNQSR